MKPNSIHAALYGVAIGDALGVPVEFRSCYGLQNESIRDFEGYKVQNQPPGTRMHWGCKKMVNRYTIIQRKANKFYLSSYSARQGILFIENENKK